MSYDGRVQRLRDAGVKLSVHGKRLEDLSDWELSMEVRLLEQGHHSKRRSCGCPVDCDYRTVDRDDHSRRSEAGGSNTVTICARCGEVIEL